MALVASLLAACETAAPAAPGPAPSSPSSTQPSPPAEVAVAFIQDLSLEGSLDRTLPVLQAVELAFATASLSQNHPLNVDVVSFDTQGDPTAATEIAREISGDPAFVAAIAAPDLPGQAELVSELSAADVPLLSLSGRGSVGAAPPGTWLRIVAPLDAQARRVAQTAATLRPARTGVCLIAAPPDGTTFARTVRRSLPHEVVEVVGAAGVEEAGCGIVVWTGDAVAGAELVAALAEEAPPTPVLVGGPVLRDPRFLAIAEASAEGMISICPCTDVSTSLDLDAQRFIQDYQSEYGSPPGPYAVEAWDATHLLIRGLREAGPGRSGLVDWIGLQTEIDGLDHTYVVEDGELADPESSVGRFRVRGGRWIEFDASTSPE